MDWMVCVAMLNAYDERRVRGYERIKTVEDQLKRWEGEGYWIGFTRLSFFNSRRLHPIRQGSEITRERVWGETKEFYETVIREWLRNSYRGNTRTHRRARSLDWLFLGFWDRGRNGFLHVHGFLAIDSGPASALSCEVGVLMARLMTRSYHPLMEHTRERPKVHVTHWHGAGRGAVKYANKPAWRAGSGEDMIFARASVAEGVGSQDFAKQ